MSRVARIQDSAEVERAAANWILRRDAGLSAEEQARFARWQAENPRHAEALARKEQAWQWLDRPLCSGQAGELLRQLERRAARNRRRWLSACAAGVACVMAVTAFLQVRPTNAIVPQANGVVILPDRQTLPDGSLVELRPGAAIAVEFTAAVRRVVLNRGEGHFDVAKDAERPFVVVAAGLEVRAVGTRFAVELNSNAIDVLVTEGSVAVDKREPAEDHQRATSPPPATPHPVEHGSRAVPVGSAPRTLTTLDAGKRLVVPLDARALVPAPTVMTADEVAARLAWRAPKLEFSETPLGRAIAMMNRYNRVQFVIDDPALRRLPVSGVFRADNAGTFVRLLEGTCGIEARRVDDTIVLKKAVR